MVLRAGIDFYEKNLYALQRSSETIRSYMKDMRLFSGFLYTKYNGEVYVDDITVEDIEDYLYYTLTERNYSPASRRRVVITLKSFFTYCVKKSYCEINVAKAVEHIKLDHKERTSLTEGEITALVTNTVETVPRLIFQTLYYTGMRVSECANLTIDNVDFDNSIIYVKAGKGKKDRNIPINEKLKPLLLEYVKLWRDDKGTGRFFCSKTGSISPSHINRLLKKSAEKAGIKKHLTAHILRHSFASNLLKNGVDILRIQKLLGHSSIKTTSIYTHTNMVDLGQAVNAL